MGKALGIDHGDARIGLALSDDLGMFAHPLETIHVAETDPIPRLVEILGQHPIDTVVLGMPYHMDGTEGVAVRKVRSFAEELRPHLGEGVDLIEIDERLTTVTARERLRTAGKKARDQKPVIDQVAAAVILQDYLDSRQGMPMLPPEGSDERDI